MEEYLKEPLDDQQIAEAKNLIDELHPLAKRMTIVKLFPFLKPLFQPCQKCQRKRRNALNLGKLNEDEINKIDTLKNMDEKLDKVIKESGYTYNGKSLSQ